MVPDNTYPQSSVGMHKLGFSDISLSHLLVLLHLSGQFSKLAHSFTTSRDLQDRSTLFRPSTTLNTTDPPP